MSATTTYIDGTYLDDSEDEYPDPPLTEYEEDLVYRAVFEHPSSDSASTGGHESSEYAPPSDASLISNSEPSRRYETLLRVRQNALFDDHRRIVDSSNTPEPSTVLTVSPEIGESAVLLGQDILPKNGEQFGAVEQHHKLGFHLSNPTSASKSLTTFANNVMSMQKVISKTPVTASSQLLTHLPRLRQGEETHISLLPCEENDKWFRMVWNKSAQDTYSIYDYQTPNLPSIIYRKQGTLGSQNYIGKGSTLKRERLDDAAGELEERAGKRLKE
jgi:hypothetical protein